MEPTLLTLVEQLRKLAGVAPEADSFSISTGARSLAVRHTGGSSETLDVSVPYPGVGSGARAETVGYRGSPAWRPFAAPRPMKIKLRAENDEDRVGKAEGIAREVQLGDPDFDARVYVDTPSDDAVVQRVLASPDARAGALALLADAGALLLDDDDGNVSISVVGFTERSPDQERAARIVAAFERLASSLPAVRAAGEAPEDPWDRPLTVAAVLAGIGAILTLVFYFVLSPEHCLEGAADGEGVSLVCSAGAECCVAAPVGIFTGLVLSTPFLLLAPRFIHGRSSSHTHLITARFVTAVILVELAVTVTRVVWQGSGG